jgi:hypothetical protein
MIRFDRSEARELLEHQGRSYTLVTTQWTLSVSTPWLGFGWSYRHPSAVEAGTSTSPIRDYVLWVRVAAALLMMITTMARRSRR